MTEPGAYLEKACVSHIPLCSSVKCHVDSVRQSCLPQLADWDLPLDIIKADRQRSDYHYSLIEPLKQTRQLLYPLNWMLRGLILYDTSKCTECVIINLFWMTYAETCIGCSQTECWTRTSSEHNAGTWRVNYTSVHIHKQPGPV